MGFAITSAWNLATKDIQQTLDGVCKKVSTLTLHHLPAPSASDIALGAGLLSGAGLSVCAGHLPVSLKDSRGCWVLAVLVPRRRHKAAEDLQCAPAGAA